MCTTKAARPDMAYIPVPNHVRGCRARLTSVRSATRFSKGPASPAVHHETSRSVSRAGDRATWHG